MLKRNPFPMIGKVFKHEMKNTYVKILVAMGILVVVSLLNYIFGFNINYDGGVKINTFSKVEYSFLSAAFKVLLMIAFSVGIFAILVYTLAVIEKRFKKTMLGDPAYVTMTLPVSAGEHLWGRFLAGMVWALACFVVIALCFFITSFDFLSLVVKGSEEYISENGSVVVKSMLLFFFEYLVVCAWILSDIFIVNGLSVVSKIGSDFLTAGMIVFFILFTQILCAKVGLPKDSGQFGDFFFKVYVIQTCSFVVLTALNFVFAHLIFAKKLNIQ